MSFCCFPCLLTYDYLYNSRAALAKGRVLRACDDDRFACCMMMEYTADSLPVSQTIFATHKG